MISENNDINRYSRQTVLREVGQNGQNLIRAASVLVVGAGGLGSPSLLYLAAAGVGKIGIIDQDVVDTSNLQRQVLFSEKDRSLKKSDVAKSKLKDLNSNSEYVNYDVFLNPDNAVEIISQYDIVIDATDRFSATYLINDVCTILSIPWIYGAISKFEGRVATFLPSKKNQMPCYRCLYPKAPTSEIGNCSDNGVIGAVAGIIGSHQALEAIKTILELNADQPCKLLTTDTISNNNFSIEISKRSKCELCSTLDPYSEKSHKILTLEKVLTKFKSEYVEKCDMTEIDKSEFATEDDLKNAEQFIDVREAAEFDEAHIDGAILMPLSTLGEQSSPLGDTNIKTIVHCRAGSRAQTAFPMLKKLGYTNIKVYAGSFDSIVGVLYSTED